MDVAITVTTAAAIVFGPYLAKDNLVCNNGTRWTCYCSVTGSVAVNTVIPRCIDRFVDEDVVAVDFRGCTIKWNSLVTSYNQTFEVYLKNYLTNWIKEECAMSTCLGYKGRDTEIQIIFVLLACSSEDNSRLLINSVQKNATFDDKHEQFPVNILARILNDRLHLLQYFLSTTVTHVSVIKVPKYSTTSESPPRFNPESEFESGPLGLNWTALIVGCILAVYINVVWIVTCFLCRRQKSRRSNKPMKREQNKNSSVMSEDSSQRLQQSSKLMESEMETVKEYDNTNQS